MNLVDEAVLDMVSLKELTREEESQFAKRNKCRTRDIKMAVQLVKLIIQIEKSCIKDPDSVGVAEPDSKDITSCLTSASGNVAIHGIVLNEGRTALMFVRKSEEVAKQLIQAGADVNAVDEKGNTPLHFSQSAEVVRMLIKHGANVNALNGQGLPPVLTIASECFTLKDTTALPALLNRYVEDPQTKISAHELVASNCLLSFATDMIQGELPNISEELASSYFRRAHYLRTKYSIPLPPTERQAMFWNRSEQELQSEYMQDLTLTEEDGILLAYFIKKRILGECLITYRCIVLIIEALVTSFHHVIPEQTFDLCRYAYAGLIKFNQVSSFDVQYMLEFIDCHCDPYLTTYPAKTIEEVFYMVDLTYEHLVTLLDPFYNERPPACDIDKVTLKHESVVYYAIYWLYQACWKDPNAEKTKEIKEKIKLFQELMWRYLVNVSQPVLHMVVDIVNRFDKRGPNFEPGINLICYLLQCGFSPLAVDYQRDTLLHELCKTDYYGELSFKSDFKVFQSGCLKLLLEYGVHVDAVNMKGISAYDKWNSSPFTSEHIDPVKHCSLQCLAARKVVSCNLTISDLPEHVQQFVSLHHGSSKTTEVNEFKILDPVNEESDEENIHDIADELLALL